MRVKITKAGIFNSEGREIEVGTELDVKNEPTGWAGRYEVISGGKAGKTAVTNPGKADKPGAETPPAPEFVAPVGPFTAKERSPGWWAIYDGKDEAVGKSVRKADLDGFDTLSEEDKAAFSVAHAKAAFEAEQKKAA